MQDKELFKKSVDTLSQMMGNFLLYSRICGIDDERIRDELLLMRNLIDNILNYQLGK